jgi:hypothetical protein
MKTDKKIKRLIKQKTSMITHLTNLVKMQGEIIEKQELVIDVLNKK